MPRYTDECVYVGDITISNAFSMWSSEITSGWIIIPDRVFIHILQFQLAALIPQHFNPKYWCFRYFVLQDSCILPLVVYYKIQTLIINPCSTRFTPRNITANTSFTANDGKIWLEDICKDRLVPLGVWERIYVRLHFGKLIPASPVHPYTALL